MKNGLRSVSRNLQTSSGSTLSRNYSQSATTLYSEILLLVKSGKRKWADEPWQFQLSLSEEMNLEAGLNDVHTALIEAREVEQKIALGNGVPARQVR